MIKIGLIGEDPNDTHAVKNLLLKKFNGKVSFIPLIRNKRGYQLDNANTLKLLRIEFGDKNPDYVIFIRDADAIITEECKIKEKKDWFLKMLPAVDNKGILLLNIYELEALILSDIKTFNRLYHVNITYNKNVVYQSKPKEFLVDKTYRSKKKYSESECPEIFNHLDFDTVCKNCSYFLSFYKELRKIIEV